MKNPTHSPLGPTISPLDPMSSPLGGVTAGFQAAAFHNSGSRAQPGAVREFKGSGEVRARLGVRKRPRLAGVWSPAAMVGIPSEAATEQACKIHTI